MISTFVSLAALVAGAPLSLPPDPAPVPAPPAVVEVSAGSAAKDQVKHTRPLPLVQVRAPQEVAPVGTEDSRSEVLPQPQRIDPPAETEAEGDAAPSAVPVDAAPEPEAAPIADPTYVSPTEKRAILKAAAGALSSVETAQGRFSQIDPTGQRAVGTFALQRPGRMRFDYDDPVPLLIAADGATVAVRDDELETVDRVPLVATPLNLLLDDRLDFETEAEVTRVIKANGQVAITMRDRTGEADGELTLYLDSASYDLMGWRTLDGNDRLTFVELRDVDTGVSLNPHLFIIEDIEDEDDDDRR